MAGNFGSEFYHILCELVRDCGILKRDCGNLKRDCDILKNERRPEYAGYVSFK